MGGFITACLLNSQSSSILFHAHGVHFSRVASRKETVQKQQNVLIELYSLERRRQSGTKPTQQFVHVLKPGSFGHILNSSCGKTPFAKNLSSSMIQKYLNFEQATKRRSDEATLTHFLECISFVIIFFEIIKVCVHSQCFTFFFGSLYFYWTQPNNLENILTLIDVGTCT